MTTTKKMNVMDRMDHVRAQSISDQEFEELWGVSMDEHLERMMAHVREFDARQQSIRNDQGKK